MHMFSGTQSSGEILKIAFNIDLAFGSVELEFHHLLAFIVIVLSSPPPRALRLDLWSRKSPDVTYSVDENESTSHLQCGPLLLLCPMPVLLLSLLSISGANATSSQSLIDHCSGKVMCFLFG